MPKTNTHQRTTAVRSLLVRAKSRFHRLHPFPSTRGHRRAPSNRVVQGSANVLTGGAGEGGRHPPFLLFFLLRRGGGGERGETHDDDGNGQDDDGNDSIDDQEERGWGESTAWPCAIPPLVPLHLQSVDGFAGVYWIDDGRPDPCPAGKRHLHHAQRLAVAGATSKSLSPAAAESRLEEERRDHLSSSNKTQDLCPIGP